MCSAPPGRRGRRTWSSLGGLFATVYKGMGLDPTTQIRDNLGRPLAIAEGKPLAGLV